MRITFHTRPSWKFILVVLLATCSWRPSLAAEEVPAHQVPAASGASHASTASTSGEQPTGFSFPVFPSRADMEKATAEKTVELATNRDIAHDTLAGAISTGLLSIITAALAFFTFKLWKDTGELVRESSKSSERQLRAYLGITATDAKLLPNVEKRNIYGEAEVINYYTATVDTMIKNHGNTPANEVDVFASWAIVATTDGGRPHASSFESGDHQGGTLMPGAELQAPLRSGIRLSPPEYSEIFEKKTKSLQVTGMVIYKDSFDKKRETAFNWVVVGNEYKVTINLCAQGNKAI